MASSPNLFRDGGYACFEITQMGKSNRRQWGNVIVAEQDSAFPRDMVFADDRLDEMTYLIPRREEVVLGGCNLSPDPSEGELPWTSPERARARDELSEAIRARFERLGFARPSVFRALCDWRPIHRVRVIVERKGRIIHNYGHGGAGFTLAYGCARSVVESIRKGDA